MQTPELALHKLPPQNIEAEQCVLGAILLENDALLKALEILRSENFYRDAHRKIFEGILALFERSEPIDLLTLTEVLRKRNQLEEVGGATYLATLLEVVPTAANVRHHARLVRETGILRSLINAATEIIAESYEHTEDVDELLDRAERLIFEISEKRVNAAFMNLKDLLKESIRYTEQLYERHELITGLPTGFHDFDQLTAGLQPSDLIIVAGRPGMGKTSYALNIARNVGARLKDPRGAIAVFSLEMSKEQLALRMLCAEARIDSSKLRRGYLDKSEWGRLVNAANDLSETPIFIDDSPALTALDLRAKARRLQAEHGLSLIIIDYLQLLRGRGRVESRQQEISEISRSLKALAKELRVPVVALSQLSRAVEQRSDRRPQLADLRECVTGETLVVLSDGRRVPIRTLVGSTPEVVSVSPEGRMIHAKSDLIWCVGCRPIFEVRLASGRAIRATEAHRLLGATGWTRIADLRVGDRLAIARHLPEPENAETWPEKRVALLGQLIGDGSYLKGQPLRYTTSSEENSQLVEEAAREEFGTTVTRYRDVGRWHQLLLSGNGNRWHPGAVNRWLRDLGIFGQRSYEKRVPETCFRLQNDQVALLLRHLWATDGSIHTRKPGQRGSHRVYYSTNSQGLALDVAALLLRLGIVARLHRVQKATYRPTYIVGVSGVEAQTKFLTFVGAFGPRSAQAERLEAVLSQTAANPNVDTLPTEFFDRMHQLMATRGISYHEIAKLRRACYKSPSNFDFSPSRNLLFEYAEALDDEELRNEATSDLFWDRIVKITEAAEEEVYDLTIPGPGSWLADSIVSHNSGALEQDADLIVFIYRDEVYNKETRDKGIAEVIIGKQRNGPIDTVKLAFLNEYARFENLTTRRDPF